MIKKDVTRGKEGIAHIKEKIAANTKVALELLNKKRTLEATKRVIAEDIVTFKKNL